MPQGTGANFRYQPQMAALLAEARSVFTAEINRRPELDDLLDLMERGIVDRDRSLEDYLTELPPAPTVYDCYVDPALTADDAANLKFKTVASAVNAMFAAGFTTVLRIGFVPRSGLTATDTVAVTTFPAICFIESVASQPMFAVNANPVMQQDLCRWQLFNANSRPLTLVMRGIHLLSSSTTATSFFLATNTSTIVTYDCWFEGLHTTTTPTVDGGGALYGRDTYYYNVCHNNGDAFLENSRLEQVRANFQWGWSISNVPLVMIDCAFKTANPGTIQLLSLRNVLINCRSARDATAASTLQVARNNSLNVIEMGGYQDSAFAFNVNTSGVANADFTLRGIFNTVTLPAPIAGDGHNVHATIHNTADITGPANLDLFLRGDSSGGTASLTLRGDRISGKVSCSGTTNVAVATLNYVAATRSAIVAAIRNSFGGVLTKPYAFDATSARNILILTGTDSFTAAGTDAGTNNRVITELGSSGIDTTAIHTGDAAGGDLAGTFPNPTVDGLQTRAVSGAAPAGADVLTWDAAGSTWKPAAAASAPEGAAAGTYGNVGVAARVTLDANGHTTAAANVIDFSQSFLTMGP